MDDADRAQEMTEVYEQAAMKRPSFFQPVQGGRKWREYPNDLKVTRGHACDDCGKAIPLKRMKANPEATRCITCQTIHERGGNA